MKHSIKKIVVPLDGSETALGLLEILIPFTAQKVTWKCGAFTTAFELEPVREYQFCHLLDKKIWETEKDADKSIPTPYGESENSVIVI